MSTQQCFVDQMGHQAVVSFPPKRIISLVPSQTELLFDLGLSAEIVGITKFCIHPAEKFKTVAKIGGTKTLRLEAIRALNPDLIIGNKEENERGQIEELRAEFPVWMSDIHSLNDAYEMIIGIGDITGKAAEALSLASALGASFENVAKNARTADCKRVLYLIWKNPYMVAGRDTFINEVLEAGGWQNVISDTRYPVVTAGDIRQLAPDLIFLSSEPYPFKEQHLVEFRQICPASIVMVVDGELFSWYGSRLRRTPEYLFTLQRAVNQQGLKIL